MEWRLVHLDRDADVVAAAYLDSISCMVRAMRIATIKKGQRILVLGDGFMSQVLAKIIHLNDVDARN